MLLPQPIENALITSPYIANVVVVGDRRKFVSALVVPDLDKLKKYASENNIAFSTTKELTEKPEIYDFYLREIDRLTPHFASYEKIKKIIILEKILKLKQAR